MRVEIIGILRLSLVVLWLNYYNRDWILFVSLKVVKCYDLK